MYFSIDLMILDANNAIDKLMYATSPPALGYFVSTRAKQYLQSRAIDRFAEDGDDAVGTWTPLKESTVQIRRDAGFVPIKINQRTHELHNWVTTASGTVASSETVTQLMWPGTPEGGPELLEKYLTAQQGKGSYRGNGASSGESGTTVARPVVGVNITDLTAILELLSLFIISNSSTGLAP